MTMLSLSEQSVLQYDGRPLLSSHLPLLRHHQLKFSVRDILQDVCNCKLIPRRTIGEPLCQLVLRVKDVNHSSSSYDKVALRTNILYKTVDAVWDIHGQNTMEQPKSHARIVASLDSDAGKADGARKALEQAFQGKNNLAKKWEEEIRKRELSGGDGSSGSGGSWGGGGGGGDEDMGEGFGQDEPWDWEEAGQTFMATFALMILYISITHGPKQVLKKFKLLFRYIWQGFRLRKIPEEYLTAEGSGIPSDDEEVDDEDDDLEDDEANEDFIRRRQEEVSISSNAQEADVQNNDAVNDETEEDEDDDIPTPPKQKREDLLSKRQAEQKEKLLKLLTPKELRQQQEENK